MGYHETDLGIDAGKTRVLQTLVTRELVTSKLSLSFNHTKIIQLIILTTFDFR